MMPDLTRDGLLRGPARDGSKLLDRVVFMTGGVYTERAREFLAAVANERIQKPFPPEQLETLVSEALRGRQARRGERRRRRSSRRRGARLMPFVDDVLKKARGGSLEEVAQGLAEALLERFSESVVLARMYVTVTQAELPEEDKAFVARLASSKRVVVTPSTPILSLIGTAGTQPDWATAGALAGTWASRWCPTRSSSRSPWWRGCSPIWA